MLELLSWSAATLAATVGSAVGIAVAVGAAVGVGGDAVAVGRAVAVDLAAAVGAGAATVGRDRLVATEVGTSLGVAVGSAAVGAATGVAMGVAVDAATVGGGAVGAGDGVTAAATVGTWVGDVNVGETVVAIVTVAVATGVGGGGTGVGELLGNFVLSDAARSGVGASAGRSAMPVCCAPAAVAGNGRFCSRTTYSKNPTSASTSATVEAVRQSIRLIGPDVPSQIASRLDGLPMPAPRIW